MTQSLILYSALIFGISFAGGALPLLMPSFRDGALKRFVSLGAGLLLGMSLLHMLPESAKLVPESFGLWFLVGFVLLFVLERFVMVHACEEHGCDYHTIGMAAFVGLAVHGAIEGFALVSTLVVTTLGPVVLFAILAHKIPAGVALTSILKLGAKSNAQVLGFVAGVALSGPIGVWLAYAILKDQTLPASAGALLAISSGTFLYIAACDLIPEIHHAGADKLYRLLLFILGLGLSFLSQRLVG